MIVGDKLTTPEGYGNLVKGTVYYFLHSGNDFVSLISYARRTKKNSNEGRWFAHLTRINREIFERGATEHPLQIVLMPKDQQLQTPPWLEAVAGIDPFQRDDFCKNAKIKHQDRVEKRYSLIQPLIERADEILASPDPDRLLNEHARSVRPKQNESRIRLWFFTYLLFDDEWALMPPFHEIGNWDRNPAPDAKDGKTKTQPKRGRPSKSEGRNSGYNVTAEMKEKMLKGYRKHRKKGKKLATVYAYSMREEFRCKTRGEVGRKKFFHPDGMPFPSVHQFRYHIRKHFGTKTIRIDRHGPSYVRTHDSASLGKFSEEIANVMEKVECDAYSVEEYPQGYLEKDALKPLYCATSVDLASGLRLGIGPSLGSEDSRAYRLMKFCMAVPKDLFCYLLFGIKVDPKEWPSIGLASLSIDDRGPGSSPEIGKDEKGKQLIHGRELTPSHSGQSKAGVESSHQRKTPTDGAPEYVISHLNPTEMFVQEIYRLIQDNLTSNASARMTPEMWKAGVVPTPVGIWSYLDERGRNLAKPIPFDKAVRSFLTPVEFNAGTDGVYLLGRRFDSKELRESGLLKAKPASVDIAIKGYMFDLSLRCAWIQIRGRIIRVNAYLPLDDDERQLNISYEELEHLDKLAADARSEAANANPAIEADIHERFAAQTGKEMDSGSRVLGRMKVTAASRKHQQEIKDITRKRKQP